MSDKIGMYTKEEILKYMTDCNGSFLGRSMFDAIFEKIDYLKQENTQLKEQISKAIERLNSKQIRFINEKDYILTDDDLDEIMQIF